MSKPANPPAFPLVATEATNYATDGMSLRDWFAGQIAAALSSAHDNSGLWTGPVDDAGARIIAERAYAVADAMLSQRSKQEQGE